MTDRAKHDEPSSDRDSTEGGERLRSPDRRDPSHRPPAPGGLRPEEVALLVKELEPHIVGSRIEKVYDSGAHGVLLRFKGPSIGKFHLLLSTRPGYTRFHLLEPTGPAADRPSDTVMLLRELLRGGVVFGIDQPGGDRMLRLRFKLKRDGATIERTLVLELFGNGGRLIAFETESRRVRWVLGRAGVEVGKSYRFPEPPKKSDTLGLPFEPERLIPEELRGEPLAFHRALAARMVHAESDADYHEAVDELARRIREERRRRRALAKKLDADAAAADAWEEAQRVGELLKGELHRIERGAKVVVVTDYYDPAMPQREIELDPRKSPADNVERYFKRAQKRKRAIPMVEARRAECDGDLERLDRAERLLEQANSAEDFEAVRTTLDRLKIRQRRSKSERSGRKKVERKRRYRSREGLDILVGRNSRENDRLSISVAKGNDLFFHRADRPGAHVILKVIRGKAPAPESLEDAAFIAAYFSGWRGPEKARVHYTYAKYVRKPKGMPPGKVLISREREFWVEYRPELLERIVVEEG
ncbi:MAG: NFACT family protein [Planctomycetota bacterium]